MSEPESADVWVMETRLIELGRNYDLAARGPSGNALKVAMIEEGRRRLDELAEKRRKQDEWERVKFLVALTFPFIDVAEYTPAFMRAPMVYVPEFDPSSNKFIPPPQSESWK